MKLEIDHNSKIPLYSQVEVLLREMIEMPEYQEGKLLPNEVYMAKEFGISRNTLRQATNILVYEGKLFRKKGVGTIVVKPINSKANNWMSFSQEMESKGITIVNYNIKISWVIPDTNVMNFFSIEKGSKVLKMERLRGKESGPFVYFISYFHPRIGLTGNEDFERPLYNILQQDFSVVAKISNEEITAEAVNKNIADKLNLSKGDPILKRKRYVYDPGRRPIEFNIGYYRSDSIVYTVESER